MEVHLGVSTELRDQFSLANVTAFDLLWLKSLTDTTVIAFDIDELKARS
jgi:hypothetical protein